MYKKILCIALSALLSFSSVIVSYHEVYAAGAVIDVVKSVSIDNVIKMVKSLYKVGYNIATTGSGDGSASSKALDSIWGEDSSVNKWLQTKLFPFMDSNGNIDLTKEDCPISYDNEKQLVEFNPTFTTELSQQVQDSIYYLDGYVLYVPEHSLSEFPFEESYKHYYGKYSDVSKDWLDANFDGYKSKFQDNDTFFTGFSLVDKLVNFYDSAYIYNINYPSRYLVYGTYGSSKSVYVYEADSDNNLTVLYDHYLMRQPVIYRNNNNEFIWGYNALSSSYTGSNPFCYLQDVNMCNAYGAPIRVFYSLQDLKNFLNKGRTYVPKLPSTTIKIPITYINNNTTLPDFNINLDSLVGKAEADIQADIDLALKNYLDKLADINIDLPTNPTPTPSHGGSSGDFGDGTTPTPKPDFSDGSSTDTNTLLQKILDKLTEFDSSHDKLAKTITDYIEKNNGKLDEIIQAIDKISQGDTEGEENGCKYDYTELSDFMTSIWNESDKKFDKMVELLEENNEYQKKLVRSLNEIKAILVTQTVLELFQDRSQQAANQAKEKFPTSIPWDISMVLNAMAAEPKELKFELPIRVESFHINESISVDLTADEWEKLAKTCRYLLSVTFILYLIHLSRKLFIKGDDD